VTFSTAGKAVDGSRFAVGNTVTSIAFAVPAGEGVELYVDEPILYDAYPESKTE